MNFNQFDSLLPPQAAERAAEVGVGKATKAPIKSFLLAISAGLHIGIAFIFYTTVTTGAGDLPWGITRLIGGLAFSLGLILVVVTGGELFTSSVLTLVARASGKISWKTLVKKLVCGLFRQYGWRYFAGGVYVGDKAIHVRSRPSWFECHGHFTT